MKTPTPPQARQPRTNTAATEPRMIHKVVLLWAMASTVANAPLLAGLRPGLGHPLEFGLTHRLCQTVQADDKALAVLQLPRLPGDQRAAPVGLVVHPGRVPNDFNLPLTNPFHNRAVFQV